MSSKRRPRSAQEDAPRTSNKKKPKSAGPPGTPPRSDAQPRVRPPKKPPTPDTRGLTNRRRDGTATLGKRAKACRNELRLLLFGITDGVPELVQESSIVHARTADPAELAASLRDLADWGRRVLASRDALVVARRHRMELGYELLEQAEVLAARVQSQLVRVGE